MKEQEKSNIQKQNYFLESIKYLFCNSLRKFTYVCVLLDQSILKQTQNKHLNEQPEKDLMKINADFCSGSHVKKFCLQFVWDIIITM